VDEVVAAVVAVAEVVVVIQQPDKTIGFAVHRRFWQCPIPELLL
jgi:hypothetical protein